MLMSIVQYLGLQSQSHCGYCSLARGDRSNYGMWLHRLSTSDYQKLIDRGWRRSGLYCYKPVLERSCCPAYVIRCHALSFKPSKSQKRVMKRFANFLKNGDIHKGSAKFDLPCRDEEHTNHLSKEASAGHTVTLDSQDSKPEAVITSLSNVKNFVASCSTRPHKKPLELLLRKAKWKRRTRKLEKLKAKGIDPALWIKKLPPVKTIEDFLNMANSESSWKHRLSVKLLCSSPPCTEFEETFGDSFNLYKKYQTFVHRDEPKSVTESKYRSFLCVSPFLLEGVDHPDHPGFGSFHYQFYLDERLVAVSVLDILPACISSKYFFYDPDLRFLSFGIYSALKEIELTRKLSQITPSLRYYYMGYYIPSCAKMRYKGAFFPSDLLCPETFAWFPIQDCVRMLGERTCCRFAPHEVTATFGSNRHF
ncbi:arginyl tRNA protein transferase 1 [Trichuris trichiura]|uniref:Arginyl-tRNA--protein transferase 1 n=1 Tax=Trichuris trichiura TaxID=36087 RepID=A0A077Z808_TRITR|nr:arginyl tRNA protein transferase 1 [Trichuris trichiura]